jgi:hypothetical protein
MYGISEPCSSAATRHGMSPLLGLPVLPERTSRTARGQDAKNELSSVAIKVVLGADALGADLPLRLLEHAMT